MLLKKVSPSSNSHIRQPVTSCTRLGTCRRELTNSRDCRGFFSKTWKSDRKHGYESEGQLDRSNVVQESGDRGRLIDQAEPGVKYR
jgi:hypothetical protein